MQDILKSLGIEESNPGLFVNGAARAGGASALDSFNPSTGERIASIQTATAEECKDAIGASQEAFLAWRRLPAPRRGEFVRRVGLALREVKEELGALVSLEMGKIRAEGEGEVQEMIDMADFCVGLSRQLYGLSMHSERPNHRMYEQWHPLGPVGVVSAFNFPVAVWSWNAFVAAVCGDTVIWKPSSTTPLCAVAVQNVVDRVVEASPDIPEAKGVFSTVIGSASTVGEALIEDPRVPLVSATGSCRMGRRISEVVSGRLGRVLLELGGNNGILVMDDADLENTLRMTLFGAVGTTGQRCTTIRRLFMQKGIAEAFTNRLIQAYKGIRIGDPLDSETIMGPLVNESAVDTMQQALDAARSQGAEVLYGGGRLDRPGHFVEPALVRARSDMKIVHEETFAPILYLMEFDDLDAAIEQHNSVPQGLSSAIFTTNMRSMERFLSAEGSDCGIANVNISTSGAEIGGAFGGEKETGGGREAGSDSWKIYMRRQTCTVNYGTEMTLAQGIEFGTPES